MAKCRLKFKAVTEIVGTEKLGLIILTDVAEQLQVTIVCDQLMERQLQLRMANPDAHSRMLPEVLSRVLKEQTELSLELFINDVRDGQYSTFLCNNETYDMIPMRASDAVLLSLVSDIPLYMDSNLMKRQSTQYREGSAGMALPINTISNDMLKVALENAIKEENYELASILRDEQKKRKGNTTE